MKYLTVLFIAGLCLTSLSACDNSYYYPDSSAPRSHGGYIERGSYGSRYQESAPEVSTTSGYTVGRSEQHSHGGYIARDSY